MGLQPAECPHPAEGAVSGMTDLENAPAVAPAKPAPTKAAASPIIPKALAAVVRAGRAARIACHSRGRPLGAPSRRPPGAGRPVRAAQ